MNQYNVIGIMSGTSLDGVDIAYCGFNIENDKWSYKIRAGKTYEYNDEWKEKLLIADKLETFDFIKLHKDYGHYLGNLVNDFIESQISNLQSPIDFISSHGHTIFHQPDKGITFQIGEGASIAAETSLTVICDFRSTDVALGGQGAPLVPVGDNLLFPEYDYCLNLGGFANISFDKDDKRIGFDICPVNIILNRLANEAGYPFDDKGRLASTGTINKDLFKELSSKFGLNTSDFILQRNSLSREWLEKQFIPILNNYDISIPDKIRTLSDFISNQIVKALDLKQHTQQISSKVLVTGGGAYNDFLIKCIRSKTKNKIIIPDNFTVEFKEALIFAFLGVLRMRNEVNCLSSVTGASRDNVGGAIY
jgi:anhydro-N-acetylmuramic acid kinase